MSSALAVESTEVARVGGAIDHRNSAVELEAKWVASELTEEDALGSHVQVDAERHSHCGAQLGGDGEQLGARVQWQEWRRGGWRANSVPGELRQVGRRTSVSAAAVP